MFTMNDAAHFSPAMLNCDVVAGYLGGNFANHVWTDDEWNGCAGRHILPIWVPSPAETAPNARTEVLQILDRCIHLGIESGQTIAFDLETSTADVAYMQEMAACLRTVGYGTLVYGSLSTIANQAPAYIWRWSADWTGVPHLIGAATQWINEQPGKPYDQSVISADLYITCKVRA